MVTAWGGLLILENRTPGYCTPTGGIPFNFLKQQSAISVGSKNNKNVSVIKSGREIRDQAGNK
jgi:hypothetical protein